ncbi:hypothetical protein M405DRAFT_845568 [Rhizopogon salebrosus TDB-379]|nr:hypothetical protein M405DRAFT_847962 [Rhizopogon salebrosus TDB-379]KAJ8583812.1 hypothetical protein M405DRAFT_845568 [Rhizopogon salebrosus TDB-379]
MGHMKKKEGCGKERCKGQEVWQSINETMQSYLRSDPHLSPGTSKLCYQEALASAISWPASNNVGLGGVRFADKAPRGKGAEEDRQMRTLLMWRRGEWTTADYGLSGRGIPDEFDELDDFRICLTRLSEYKRALAAADSFVEIRLDAISKRAYNDPGYTHWNGYCCGEQKEECCHGMAPAEIWPEV